MYLIVGIDPGTTSAIAALDLRGNHIHSWSAKGAGLSGIIEQIRKTGKPSLIACDVFPVPDSVSKIAAQFNVRIFAPEKSFTELEKQQLTSSFPIKNSHERDALACAIKAYRSYANRLRQIELLEELGENEKDKLKDLVLNGYSLKRALLFLARRDETPEVQMPKAAAEARQKDLAGEVANLSSENVSLRKALEALERERGNLLQRLRLLENGVYERLRRDSELRKLRAECDRLRSLLKNIFSRNQARREQKRAQNNERMPAEKQKITSEHGEAPATLKDLSDEDMNLEKLVEEYRNERSPKTRESR